jgi:hypothetical protein
VCQSNVRVDNEGRAKLIDFGVSRITGEHGYITSGASVSIDPGMVEYGELHTDAPSLLLQATQHHDQEEQPCPEVGIYALYFTSF